jgi:uncharacterized membrane protein YeaQ/YmgE (transglycosylase-associated protein family)
VYVVGLLISGLVVGAFGRLLVPGRQPLGCFGTIAAGLLGSLLAGLVGRHVFHAGYVPGFIASVLGAAVVVWIASRLFLNRPRP